MISKFQIGLKSLLRLELLEPKFYGDLVYKLKKIAGSNDFLAQFIKMISHYKKIGYNINIQLLSKIFIDSDFCHNYLHIPYLFFKCL